MRPTQDFPWSRADQGLLCYGVGMGTYRAVVLAHRGGVEGLQTVELPLEEPGPGEVRVAVRAAGAGGTDLLMRRGLYPGAPRMPFVLGYDAVGEVEALGPGVEGLAIGQRVAALLGHGGYAEKLVRPANLFVPVPPSVDDESAISLVLNYVTAWQCLHRVAALKAGDTALVTGANGGVGTALLELMRLADIRALGAAGAAHHDLVRSYGAAPLESRGGPLDAAVRALAPEGVAAAFDCLGGKYSAACVRATRRGGTVVAYGFGAAAGRSAFLRGLAGLYAAGWSAGRRPRVYRISSEHRRHPGRFRDDLAALFALLAEGKLHPRIAARLPLLAARESSALLEKGGLNGKIVHLASQREPTA
ncbi:MAG TPA: zinc-binding dehydrogenase [Myxococcales bacterium]|nr:zinc-binding dehydrogenase [Myxococcales bacterium]